MLPACREFDLPLSLMIGVRYLVNPALKLAGDAAGKADLRAVERLCAGYPGNRYLISVLSRENQHELCVYARKFNNLMPFGCWWFLNNPSIVEEITRERLEMLGHEFYSAAFRCARAGAGDLQVAQHAPHHGADPGQRI